MTDNIENYRNQIALARTEIKNLRQQLVALKNEHLKEIKLIKGVLNDLRCASCNDNAATVVTNHVTVTPSTSSEVDSISFRPIGVIETSFQNKRGVPRQPTVMAKSKGTVLIDTAVFSNPEHALSGLEEFSHMWILFHFHETLSTSVPAKVAPPRLRGERRGVLSTRSPHRPCPIGLSLVQIQGIEGNKVHFLGVDMVSGSPVLDIKPYIPQYDCPRRERPPTEGVSDLSDGQAGSLAPHLSHLSVDTSPCQSPYGDDLLSPELPGNTMTVSPSPVSPGSEELLEGSPNRMDSERGAPDGQERFTPPSTAHLTSISQDGIRIAPWISNPPMQTYRVRFTDDAYMRLTGLIGDRAETFKTNIESLLSEDPRSHYVRTRYPDHEYSCVLEELSISCVFDASTWVCSIVAVRTADEMHQA